MSLSLNNSKDDSSKSDFSLLEEIRSLIINFETSTLDNTLKCLNFAPMDRDKMIDTYQKAIILNGARLFVSRLDRSSFKQSCDIFGIKNPKVSSLVDKIVEGGVVNFLNSISNRALLYSFCKSSLLNDSLNDYKEDSVDALRTIVADEIMLSGYDTFLHQLTLPILKDHCREVDVDSMGAQPVMIENYMNHIFKLIPIEEYTDMLGSPERNKKRKIVKDNQSSNGTKILKTDQHDDAMHLNEEFQNSEGSEKESRNKTRSKHIPPPLDNIKRGISAQDLHNLYNFKDLQEWCKNHQLEYIGKKGFLIKRILNYLETGEIKEKKKKGRRISK